MLKYLGSVGTFIRLNDSENKTYKLLEIFSSSAASELLFSASVNNLSGAVTINTASTSLYINGNSASVLPSQQWAHLTISFDNKLWTYDTNNFLIRFGDSASSNFNIQNLYILENSLNPDIVEYINQEFTGTGNKTLRINDSASYSINIIDTLETNYISPITNTIYQPINNQKKFTYDIAAATTASLSLYVSASLMSSDALYIDNYLISSGDKVLSFTDQQLYELTSSATLIPLSSSIGDYVRILFGQQYSNLYYLYTASGYQVSAGILKINSIANRLK